MEPSKITFITQTFIAVSSKELLSWTFVFAKAGFSGLALFKMAYFKQLKLSSSIRHGFIAPFVIWLWGDRLIRRSTYSSRSAGGPQQRGSTGCVEEASRIMPASGTRAWEKRAVTVAQASQSINLSVGAGTPDAGGGDHSCQYLHNLPDVDRPQAVSRKRCGWAEEAVA